MLNTSKIRTDLLSKRIELEERVGKLRKDIHHRDEPLDPDFAEQVVEQENLDVLYALDGESRLELQLINKALVRLDNDEYDICNQCGDTIAHERLNAIPYTITCISCAE